MLSSDNYVGFFLFKKAWAAGFRSVNVNSMLLQASHIPTPTMPVVSLTRNTRGTHSIPSYGFLMGVEPIACCQVQV